MKSSKQFILDTLLPYKKNPETCGYDAEEEICLYLAPDGKKCAIGKHLKKGEWQDSTVYIGRIIEFYGLENIFKKPAIKQGFSLSVWSCIQGYHDCLALSLLSDANQEVAMLEIELNINLDELRFTLTN